MKESSTLGPRKLTTLDAVGQSLALGPIASVFLVGSLIAATAGRAAPFVVLVALAGALCLAWTLSLYARRVAAPGVLYEYLTYSYGERAAVFASLAWLAVLLPVIGTTYVAIGSFSQFFLVAEFGIDPGWWSVALAAGVIGTIWVYLGVSLTVRTQLVITVVSALPLILMAIVVIARGGHSGNSLTPFMPALGGDVWKALLFAFGLFGGFETAAALGEETREPLKTIPRAMLVTVAAAGAFYLLLIYAVTIGADAARSGDPLTIVALGDAYVGEPVGGFLMITLIIDLFAILLASTNATARVIFALARDRAMPRMLARTSSHDTPVAGIAVCFVASVAVLSWAGRYETPFIVLEPIFVASGLIALPVLIAVTTGGFRLVTGPPWRYLLPTVAVLLLAMALYGTLVPFPNGPARSGIWYAIAAVMLAAIGGRLGSRLEERSPN